MTSQLRNPDGRGAVDNVFETARGRTSFESLEQVERYLRLALGAVCVVPLYLFDHSGISMSAGSNYVGMGDMASGGRDALGERARLGHDDGRVHLHDGGADS